MVASRIAAASLSLLLTAATAQALGGGGPAAMRHNGDKYRSDGTGPAAPPRLNGAHRDGGGTVHRSRRRGRMSGSVR